MLKAWAWRVALGAVLTVVMTWPTAGRLGSAGRLNFGDGEWSLWNVTWVAHALTSRPTQVFEANIFHPDPDTLAFSEANIVSGALGVPFYLLSGGNPYATHNGAKLVAFTLAFVFTWALVGHLGASPGVACVAAIAFAFCPYVFARTAHIQLMMTFGLPLSLWLFHRLVELPSLRRGLLLGVALGVQALACGYFGIFAGLAVGLGTVFFAWTRGLWRNPSYWLAVGSGALLSVALVAPFFVPFLRVKGDSGFERTLEDAAMFSADWQAWLASSAWAHRWMLPWLGTWSDVLFPGAVCTALGLAGLVLARRWPASAPVGAGGAAFASRPREAVGFYALLAGLAFWASFGPAAGLYTWLHTALPVFAFLRAPARFGILVTLALTVIAAALLQRWLGGMLPRRAGAVAAGVCLLALADTATAPLALQPASTPARAHHQLALLPRGAVIELPFWHLRDDYSRHARYMLYSTYHWQPLVNGYSDHIPQWFRDQAETLDGFPSRASFAVLRAREARYAVFHVRWYDADGLAALRARLDEFSPYLRRLDNNPDVWLFEIVGYPVEAGGPWAVESGGAGAGRGPQRLASDDLL